MVSFGQEASQHLQVKLKCNGKKKNGEEEI